MSAKYVRAREPSLTRKGLLGHPRTLLLTVIAIVFTAYVLGYLPQLDSFFGSAVEKSRSHGLFVVGPIILFIVGLFVLFIFVLILGFLSQLLTSLSRRGTFFGRQPTTLDQFIALAQAQGVSPRVAKETYQILEPYYPRTMCIDLEDELRRHLIFKDENILYIQSRLLNRCDRREVLSFSVETIQTVFDLMLHAEGAPPQHVSGAVVRRRRIDFDADVLVDRRRQDADRSQYTDHNRRLNLSDRRTASRWVDEHQQPVAKHGQSLPPTSPAIQPPLGNSLDSASTPRNASGIRHRKDAILAPLPPIAASLGPQDGSASSNLPHADDTHLLPPRRREYSGMFRRATDPPAPPTTPAASQPSNLDDPDFRPRARPDYSGILRRASDSTAANAESQEKPLADQSVVRRRVGEIGFHPRPFATYPEPPPTGTTEDNLFIAPRRQSDNDFRRRTTDALAIEPDANQK